MSAENEGADRAVKSLGVEIAFALLIILLGALAITDSLRLGIGWAADGPRAGFFPFWIGLLLAASGVVVIALALIKRTDGVFARTSELKQVGAIAVPTAVFIAAIPFAGVYLAGAALISGFMRLIGGYAWHISLATGASIMIAFFVVFELWFLVSMPKGPIETALGF
jgi:putative tricarboxylic transport membrane protein